MKYPELVGRLTDRIKKRTEPRLERARKLVQQFRVKQHLFHPSKRTIWTVVGKEGDVMVNLDRLNEPSYCSCNDFHFRVLSGEIAECYHLIAVRQAIAEKKAVVTNFSDEEYESFLKSLLLDLFSRI